MSTPHKSLIEDRMRVIAMQEVMQHIKCLKVELHTNSCNDTGVVLEVRTTLLGQNISSNTIFIPFPKTGGNKNG